VNEPARLTPWMGDCVTPRTGAGASRPSASSTVGTMSIACPYCVRIWPLALMPLGQWTMKGSETPPRWVSRLQRRNGVLPANVQPHG